MDPISGSGGYLERAITVTEAAGDPGLRDSWKRIVVPDEIKRRLLNHALMAIELRSSGVSAVGLPLHGLVVLSGPPGVGKTSLARGLGSEVAAVAGGRYGPVRVMDVDLHVLPSELLGRTQRNIHQLFLEELPKVAADGPVVLVLDELEVLAVSRLDASLDINPADVVRGTAALVGALDQVSQTLPGVVVVGTTNVPGMLDSAVRSRADLWLELPMPGVEVITAILRDTFAELARMYPGCASLAGSARLAEVAGFLAGRDCRQVRKFVGDVLALSGETALDPSRLSMDVLVEAAAAGVGAAGVGAGWTGAGWTGAGGTDAHRLGGWTGAGGVGAGESEK